MRTRPVLIVAACAASPIVAACGSSAPDASKFVDNEKVERAIERSVLAEQHKLTFARCPALETLHRHATFTCSVQEYDRRVGPPQTFTVTQVDGSGHVRYVGPPAP